MNYQVHWIWLSTNDKYFPGWGLFAHACPPQPFGHSDERARKKKTEKKRQLIYIFVIESHEKERGRSDGTHQRSRTLSERSLKSFSAAAAWSAGATLVLMDAWETILFG